MLRTGLVNGFGKALLPVLEPALREVEGFRYRSIRMGALALRDLHFPSDNIYELRSVLALFCFISAEDTGTYTAKT